MMEEVESRQDSGPYSIYKLVDQRDMSVHYVGLSKQPYRRYGQHLTLADNNVAKNTWILEITEQGYLPQLEIIEQVNDLQQAKQRESYWINVYLAVGMPLSNIQQGFASSFETEQTSAIGQLSLALDALQATASQLSRQIAMLQMEIEGLKKKEVDVSSVRQAYVKMADLARRKESVRPQQKVEEKIIARLIKTPSSTVRELSNALHLDTETVRSGLKMLLDSGAIEETRVGKTFRYRYIMAS